jgi:ribosomal protein S19
LLNTAPDACTVNCFAPGCVGVAAHPPRRRRRQHIFPEAPQVAAGGGWLRSAARRWPSGIKRKPISLLKKLRKAKRETAYGEKPEAIKTHLRNMVIVPEMIGSVVGVYHKAQKFGHKFGHKAQQFGHKFGYNGKQYISVEIKPDMIGHYLAEFSITYKPIRHGRSGGKGDAYCPLR